jgi:hypothetical protein
MNRQDQDQLLNEILGGDRLEGFRRATLQCGLDALRRRRRHFVKASALACLLLLAFPAIRLFKELSPTQNVASFQALPKPVANPLMGNNGINVISDEELFALFPNRPLALVGKPGHQQLVFLDQPRTSNQPLTQ